VKITDMWQEGRKPTVSFELFPARSEKAAANLDKAIETLAGLGPDFVSVTFGAGGSTRRGSYELIKKLKVAKRLEVFPYFACYGLGPDAIMAVVNDYLDLGVESLLAVRGDPPRDQEELPRGAHRGREPGAGPRVPEAEGRQRGPFRHRQLLLRQRLLLRLP